MKQIIITCDTEVGELAGDKEDAFEIFIEGKIGKEEVGYAFINKIASSYGVVVEHFVDVYPFHRYGEQLFRKLCESILAQGHKIGLHTHPSNKYDRYRKFMWQYSLEDQSRIVEFGKEKIREWTGVIVNSHRAGGYGANADTLLALSKNGIHIDLSHFPVNTNSRIGLSTINAPSFFENVLEIPVTVYEKNIHYGYGIRRKRIQKLDFRYGSTSDEIVNVVEQMDNNSIIVIFMHSFNFLNLPYNFRKQEYGHITVNVNMIDEFIRVLEKLSQMQDVTFVTSDKVVVSPNIVDVIPTITVRGNILKSIILKISNSFSNIRNT